MTHEPGHPATLPPARPTPDSPGVPPSVPPAVLPPPPSPPTSRKATASLRRRLNASSSVRIVVQVRPGSSLSVLRENVSPFRLATRQLVRVAGMEFFSIRAPVNLVDALESSGDVERIFFDAPKEPLLMGGPILTAERFPVLGKVPFPVGYFRDRLRAVSIPVRKGWIESSRVRTILGADKAFQEGYTGAGTSLCVIDTGVWFGHRAFAERRPIPYSVHRGNRLGDASGHGSWCCAQAAGGPVTAENGLHTEGVSRAQLSSIKALETPLGVGTDSDIMQAIGMATEVLNAKVISMSLGGEAEEGEKNDPVCIVLNRLAERGHIFVVAVGNSGPSPKTIGTPGQASSALTVGAVSITDGLQPSWFSSRGPTTFDGLVKPDVVAPGGGRAKDDAKPSELLFGPTSIGGELDSTDVVRSGFAVLQGSSMATPAMAGLIAIWNDWFKKNRGREIQMADIQRVIAKMGHVKNNDSGFGMPTYDWVKAG